jgi:hypothetical protein
MGDSNSQNVFIGGFYMDVRRNLLITIGLDDREEVIPETPV